MAKAIKVTMNIICGININISATGNLWISERFLNLKWAIKFMVDRKSGRENAEREVDRDLILIGDKINAPDIITAKW